MTRIFSQLKIWGAALGVLIAALFTAYSHGRKSKDNDNAKDTIKSQEKGREAVARGRASGDTADQRVRDNDGRWM